MARSPLGPTTKRRGQRFSVKLQRARKSEGISREQLARRAGVSTETVRSIEEGKIVAPGLFVAADIVYALNGRLDEWLRDRALAGRTRSQR